MKLGGIGYGLISGAILGGIVNNDLVKPENITISDKFEGSRKRAVEAGFTAVDDNMIAAKNDVLLVAVQPWLVPAIMDEIKDTVKENGTIVWCVAAGVTIAELEEHLGSDAKIVRCMPNTCAQVGAAVTAVVPKKNVSKEETEIMLKLISGFGIAEILDESKLNGIIPVTGSSPAMVFMLIDAMANGAAREGFTWEQAIKFSAQAVKGSAEMVLRSGKHPAELQNQVCTPGGITIEMVKRLESFGFRNAVMEAMQACTEDLD